MRSLTTPAALALGATALLVISCSDNRSSMGDAPLAPQFAQTACDMQGAKSDAQAWFPNGPRQTVQNYIKVIEDNCSTHAVVANAAWAALQQTDVVFNQHAEEGSGAVLSSLVNKLLDCIADTGGECADSGSNFDGVSVQSEDGAFGVRIAGGGEVTARGPTSVEYGGTAYDVTFGIEPSCAALPPGSGEPCEVAGEQRSWAAQVGTPTLMAGFSTSASPGVNDDEDIDAAYSWENFPAGDFPGSVDVGYCVAGGVSDDSSGLVIRILHIADDEGDGDVVLATAGDLPSWCVDGEVALAETTGFLGTVRNLLASAGRLLAPAPLRAAMRQISFTLPPGGTSSTRDLSIFNLILTGDDGQLMFVEPEIPPVVKAGAPFNFAVKALTSGENPVVVDVLAYVCGNEGEPAGAILYDSTGNPMPIVTTNDSGPDVGVAFFNQVNIPKKGGYRICAQAADNLNDFGTVISDLFHIR